MNKIKNNYFNIYIEVFCFLNDCDIINLWKKLKKKIKIALNSQDG